MNRFRRGAVLALTGVIAAAVSVSPAYAADTPTYTCAHVHVHGSGASGKDCVGSEGAQENGELKVDFVIKNNAGDVTLTCTPDDQGSSGSVGLPGVVDGSNCTGAQ